MLHDQHCHTSYSLDSKANIEKYYQIASNYQTKYFVTTEHIEFSSAYNHQDWTVNFEQLINELTSLKNIFQNVTPLLGVEIGYKKNYIHNINDVINSYEFDFINLSIHDNDVYDYYLKDAFISIGIDNMLKIYFNNIIDALKNFENFDVLSHFDYGFKTAYLIDNSLLIDLYESYIRKIFKLLIKQNKTLEINMKVENILGVTHLKKILKWYQEEGGVKLSLSSDSHNEDAYEKYYQRQISYFQIFKDLGFNELRYFVKRKEYIYNIKLS